VTTIGALFLIAAIVSAVVVLVRQAQGKPLLYRQSARARTGYVIVAAVMAGVGLVLLLSP
jgi:hypothetical protein